MLYKVHPKIKQVVMTNGVLLLNPTTKQQFNLSYPQVAAWDLSISGIRAERVTELLALILNMPKSKAISLYGQWTAEWFTKKLLVEDSNGELIDHHSL